MGVLPHVFGVDHKGQTLNLGGNFNYRFNENKTKIEVVKETESTTFISDFWAGNITSINTFIGKNGVGKTSLLRAFNNPIDSGNRKLVYVIELKNTKGNKIVNETTKKIVSKIKEIFNEDKHVHFEPLFYSSSLDYDLRDTLSPIALINYFKDNLENYFLESVSRNVMLLNNPIINEIRKVYNDFPFYDIITVSAKKHRKSKFTQVYIESNFGNPNRGESLINELEGDIRQMEDKDFYKETFSKKEVINILKGNVNHLKSESFTEQFNKIWNLKDYEFIDKSGYDYIHDSESFIKNLEINLLSYLLLGAVFPQTGLGGSFNFNGINKTTTFEERLDLFLEMYFVNEYYLLTEKIKTDLKGISLSNSNKIIEIINKDSWVKSSGIEIQPIRDRMKKHLESFNEVKEFYRFLVRLFNSKKVSVLKSGLVFNLKNSEVNLFNELIEKYKSLLSVLPNTQTDISILDFTPNKKLSTGEKAILDFYASLFKYVENNKGYPHRCFSNYLLLLDEPELGFHPLWKKKFINAVVKTLPILFSELVPQKYNNTKKIYEKTGLKPNLQIIFTTHDPLTLSDIPNSNIIYLDKEKGITRLIDNSKNIKKSFGGNITDLLSDGFFINDGLIGDFSKEKIETTIYWINSQKKLKESLQSQYIVDQEQYEYHKKVIAIIDEHVIRLKLAEMLEELKGDKKLQAELIEREIQYLQNKRNSL